MEKLLNDYKISFTKGDTYALAVKFKNITSDLGSAYFTVKENADDEPLIQKSLGAGVTKIDDRSYKQEKTYKIQLQSEDTADLEPLVQYLYDFRVAFGNVVQTILSGVFVVKHNVTDVSTTSTTTLDVTLSDILESEVSTTPPTQGIEYEQDPVANAKIGDLTGLTTIDKETVVKAINEVNRNTASANTAIRDILNGTQQVPDAENAGYASNAGTSSDAHNVTDAIRDVPLSQIFENDHKTIINATNAKIADYASSDTSKGTIEARLTKLGFKEGSATFSNSISIYSTTHNFWKRQGNYVFGRVKIVLNSYYNVRTFFTLPEYARPKENVEFVTRVTVQSYSGSTYKGMYTVPAIATINTNGVCTISFEASYNSGTSTVYSSTFTEIGSTFEVDFGFEANPIT